MERLRFDPAPAGDSTAAAREVGDGSRGWNGAGYRAGVPRIVDPPDGRLWTANARVAKETRSPNLETAATRSDSRALIRERRSAKDQFTARDLLAIQLDTRAAVPCALAGPADSKAQPEAVRGHDRREELRRIVEGSWTGQAAPDSAAYRLTRYSATSSASA